MSQVAIKTKFPFTTVRTVLLVAIAYVISGKLALMLALPPGYATSIFPPAGIAVAAILAGGVRLLPGVLLGAFALNIIQSISLQHGLSVSAAAAALMVAVGSSLQAWVGAGLLRRWVRPALDSGRDVLLYLAFAPAMCLIGSTVGVTTLLSLSMMSSADVLTNWLNWWVGDTIGVMLTAPLLWIFIGKPRRLWWRRRWMLSVPLAISSALFIFVYVKASAWEQEQLNQAFNLKSQQVGDVMQAQFQEHERLLQSLASVLNQRDAITSDEFGQMARGYLEHRPDLRSMTWAPRVTLAERGQFESWARETVSKDFFVKEPGAEGRMKAVADRSQYYPLTYIEPLLGKERLQGLDLLFEPIRARALLAAIQSGRPTASEMITLVHNEEFKKGIMLCQAIKLKGHDAFDSPVGMLSIVMQIEPYLNRAVAGVNFPNFLIRLEDISSSLAEPKVLIDQSPREAGARNYQKELDFGGRRYLITLAPTSAYLDKQRIWQSWTALVCGFLLIGLLVAFLLLMTGQREQIEDVVADRTRKLYDREARLQAILSNAAHTILTIDFAGKVISANGAASGLFGHSLDALKGLAFDKLIKLGDNENVVDLLDRLSRQSHQNNQMTGLQLDGRLFPMAISVSLVNEVEESFYVAILIDLTEQQRSQEQIYRLAHHDPLTGLANRFALNQRLEQLLSMSRRGQAQVAVMFIDLDHFKKINDSLGHQVGDQLLIEAADRLKKLLRDTDIVARPGGDEFVVILANYDSIDNVTSLAARIIAGLAQTYQLGGRKLHSGASVGISTFPSDGTDADTLLRNADAAMYVAKGKGRGNYQFYSSELNAEAHRRLQIENQILQGLERNEFELYLQPQMHLASRRIIGAEALIRWHHPELGMVPPDRFIPIAEESGLILQLGEWVLERAMHILAGWQDGTFAGLRLAINLSARQCNSDTLIKSLDRLQAETRVDLRWLEVEITETAAMQDPEQTRALLRQLRSRGIKVAIDDFGTGYSSLSYLKIFAIDRIKIDRSFVKDIEKDQNDALIASATIGLAHNLGLEVIAEGVETEGQCAFLNHELCDEAQGYLFSRPIPLADFETLVRAEQAEDLPAQMVANT